MSPKEEIPTTGIEDRPKDKVSSVLDQGESIGARRWQGKFLGYVGGVLVVSATAFIVYQNKEGIVSFIKAKIPHSEDPKSPTA